MGNRRGNRSITWHTALRCNGGACIQVAASGQAVLIGNSNEPSGPVLTYTHDELQEFVVGVKKGDFDKLLG